MTALTPRQEVLLAFLRDYQREHGYMPSHREMLSHLGCTAMQTVTDLLIALEKKGAIRRTYGIARAIQVLG